MTQDRQQKRRHSTKRQISREFPAISNVRKSLHTLNMRARHMTDDTALSLQTLSPQLLSSSEIVLLGHLSM